MEPAVQLAGTRARLRLRSCPVDTVSHLCFTRWMTHRRASPQAASQHRSKPPSKRGQRRVMVVLLILGREAEPFSY